MAPARLEAPAAAGKTGRVRNAVELVAVLLLPTLVGVVATRGVRLARRLPVPRRHTGPVPTVPPVERTAADLRRLRAQLDALRAEQPGPGRGVRVRALEAAYADAFEVACRQLELPPPRRVGGRLPPGEMYRAEAALRARGLDVRPPPVG